LELDKNKKKTNFMNKKKGVEVVSLSIVVGFFSYGHANALVIGTVNDNNEASWSPPVPPPEYLISCSCC
jgi:hypothetical protein